MPREAHCGILSHSQYNMHASFYNLISRTCTPALLAKAWTAQDYFAFSEYDSQYVLLE